MLVTAAAGVLLSAAQAADGTDKVRFNFRDAGGAKSSLGVARLERIRKRSQWHDKTADEVAQMLEQDADLVRRADLGL